MKIAIAAGAAPVLVLVLVLLGACHRNDAPVKRQPGSWSSKVELVKLEGADVQPDSKAKLQQMFDMMGKISVCVTPEAAAKEDIQANLEHAGGAGKNCTFDKHEFSGETIAFAGTCKDQDKTIRMSATGSTSATQQDLTMTIEPLDAAGKPEGTMQMHVLGTRNGECKAGDITPPAPAENASQ